MTALPMTNAAPVSPARRQLSALFIENIGQFNEAERFRLQGTRTSVRVTQDGVWLTLPQIPAEPETGLTGVLGTPSRRGEPQARKGTQLKLSYTGANPHPPIEGVDRLETAVSYFLGSDPDHWRANVPVWGRVRYVDLYPGVDLEIIPTRGGYDQRFIVRRVDPAGVAALRSARLRVDGATQLGLAGGNTLQITTDLGGLLVGLAGVDFGDQDTSSWTPSTAPLIEGSQVVFPFKPLLEGSSASSAGQASISSPTLGYSTLLGGGADDEVAAIAVDDAGNAYVVGSTASSNFPVTPGAFQTRLPDVGPIAFVAKLDPTGSRLLYATFLGGSGQEVGRALTIDKVGNAYLAGLTGSPDFPTTPGAPQNTLRGSNNAFVAKLNPTGNSLLYATYLGGSGHEDVGGIAVDHGGNVYLSGWTASTDFPTTSGAFQAGAPPRAANCFSRRGSPPLDAFVAKLNPGDTTLVYSTYLGGSCGDVGGAIAVDQAGSAYVIGSTASIDGSSDFPTTPGAFQTAFGGGRTDVFLGGHTDVFVAKLNPTGSVLVYSTLLGGAADDRPGGIAVDPAGNAFVAGTTNSPDFPTISGALQTSLGGGAGGSAGGAFVVKLNPAGDGLVYCMLLGESGGGEAFGIALGSADTVYVTGEAGWAGIAVSGDAAQKTLAGRSDAFVAIVNPEGSGVLYSSFLGGGETDWGASIAVDTAGDAYVAGFTRSADFPTSPGAFQSTFGGGSDGFVAKFRIPADLSRSSLLADPSRPAPGERTTITTLLRNTGGVASGVTVTATLPVSTAYVSASAMVSQGTVSGTGPIVYKVGTLSPTIPVTLTFAVTVATGITAPTAFQGNTTISWTGANGPGSLSLSETVIVNGRAAYLPVVLNLSRS